MLYLDLKKLFKEPVKMGRNNPMPAIDIEDFPTDILTKGFNALTGKTVEISGKDIKRELLAANDFSCFYRRDRYVYIRDMPVYQDVFNFEDYSYKIVNLANSDVVVIWHDNKVYCLEYFQNQFKATRGVSYYKGATFLTTSDDFVDGTVNINIITTRIGARAIKEQGACYLKDMSRAEFNEKAKAGYFDAMLSISIPR